MSISFSAARRTIFLGSLVVTLLIACHLANEPANEQVFSLPTAPGSLQACDSALIILKTPAGDPIDTLFADKVAGATFTDMVAEHYQGGKAVISIEGFKNGTLIVKLEKVYSGTSGHVDTTIVILAGPVPRVRVDSVVIAPLTGVLQAGGAAIQLRASVYPETTSQAVVWRSLDPGIAEISLGGNITGKDSGYARIVAASVADPRVSDTASLAVAGVVRVGSVAFDRSTLDLYVEGASEILKISVLPEGSNQSVVLTVEDSTVAQAKDGMARGLKAGETRIIARSESDSSKSAVLTVVVHAKPLAAVDSVTVSPDTLRLYTGGESKPLAASIFPKFHLPEFAWQSAAPGIATVDTAGTVSPVGAGKVYVRARSRVDSTKADSSIVIVKKDVPRILVGNDTTVSLGATVLYVPVVQQDYGSLVEARWDLDDSASWDETATAFRPLSRNYPVAKEYLIRFYAKDSEGNDTTVVKKVKVVNGPVILFKSPMDGSYTNINPIPVVWSVDGAEQAANETLKPGPNTITRSAKNAAGESFSAGITVNFDTVPPGKPFVKGINGPIRTLRPAWTWERAGSGNGTFRWRLDIDNMATGATTTTDTALTPGFDLTTGTHTLYVQERDAAGNWSASGIHSVRIDTTAPPAPAVTAVTPTPTLNRLPTWGWTGTASEGTSSYRYKLDNNDFRTGAIPTALNQFKAEAGGELGEGPHFLFVQQADSAGNWSLSGSAVIRIDLTAPAAPKVTPPASPSNDRTPSFTFTPQGGGNGTYRVKFNDRNLAAGAIEVNSAGYTPTDSLAPGKWVLHVQERDTAGNWSASDSGTVTIDLTIPASPTVNAPDGTPTRITKPRWNWKQPAGGTGQFRFKFNDANLLAGATETTDTLYVHGTDLTEGTYTVYVQQKNAAGTWSPNGSKAIRLDLTKPAIPVVTPVQASPTNERRPTWNWNHSEPGVGFYRYSLDGAGFRDTNATSFRPGQNLSEATHSLRIQESDSAGNWSDIATSSLSVDATSPGTPLFNTTQPRSPSTSLRPIWTWASGGGAGGDHFKYSLDNAAFKDTVATSFQPSSNLSEGAHTLRIQEIDPAGNPSGISSRQIILSTRGYVGTPDFSNGQMAYSSMAFKGGDTAYVAYLIDGKMKVKRFSNGSWTDQGTGLFAGTCYMAYLNVNHAGIPYVAFQESDSGNQISVMRLVGNSWAYVGYPRFSTANVNNPQIHFGPTDIPYVIYEDGPSGNTPMVASFNGFWNNLEQTGLPEFGFVDYAMAFQKNGDPVVAFAAYSDDRVAVVRYSSARSAWDTLGNIVSLNKYTDAIDLVINDKDEPIIAFRDNSNWRISVLKMVGSAWTDLGTTGQPEASGGQVGVALGIDQNPIISFGISTEANRATVMTLIGTKWEHMGPSGLSESGADFITIKTNSLGVPYVCFKDAANSWGISVMKTAFDP